MCDIRLRKWIWPLAILQPKVEYSKMGNLTSGPFDRVLSPCEHLSRSVEMLATRLRLPTCFLLAYSLRLPDGPTLYTPRFRWCLLIKAIVEEFCPAFAPGGVVLYIGDTE